MTQTLPPRAEARPLTLEAHGITRQDEYAWLRAENWQDVMRDPSVLAPDIRAYLEAENAYLETVMAPTKELQDKLFAEMKGRIKEDDSSVPMPDGPFEYGVSYVTGGQHPRLVRSPLGGGAQEMRDRLGIAEPAARFGGGTADGRICIGEEGEYLRTGGLNSVQTHAVGSGLANARILVGQYAVKQPLRGSVLGTNESPSARKVGSQLVAPVGDKPVVEDLALTLFSEQAV